MLIMFFVDKSKQYPYSYTKKNYFTTCLSLLTEKIQINACRITANKRPWHRNHGLNTYILSH